jgi:hypothetical protein
MAARDTRDEQGGHGMSAQAVTGAAAGPLLFGRYAFPPNRLGYCGPNETLTLLEYVAERRTDHGLVELERRFAGAFPYLQLIAHANGIADPFDQRVVEAYWIGNPYLERVDAAAFHQSLDERFHARMDTRTFGWLTTKLELGARPHHNFHVFEVYTRAGLMNDRAAPVLLETMDSCRISWGKVIALDGASLLVARRKLVLDEGKLALGSPEVLRVARQLDGRGFVDDARPGDYVSVHWDWACEVLRPVALTRLRQATRRYIALANQTL